MNIDLNTKCDSSMRNDTINLCKRLAGHEGEHYDYDTREIWTDEETRTTPWPPPTAAHTAT